MLTVALAQFAPVLAEQIEQKIENKDSENTKKAKCVLLDHRLVKRN